MEGDDGMNWDLQPDQVQPCRTADGRPVILGTGAYGNVSTITLLNCHLTQLNTQLPTELACRMLHAAVQSERHS